MILVFRCLAAALSIIRLFGLGLGGVGFFHWSQIPAIGLALLAFLPVKRTWRVIRLVALAVSSVTITIVLWGLVAYEAREIAEWLFGFLEIAAAVAMAWVQVRRRA